MSKPSEFSKGTRVTHEFYTSLGTVVGEVRQYRGPGLKDDVEVKFDDGAHDHCHLDFMTVVAPSVHVPKFAIGDRINHFIHGHGTVVGAPRKSNWNNEWCVPVRYDDGMRIQEGDFESNMTAIPMVAAMYTQEQYERDIPKPTVFTQQDVNDAYQAAHDAHAKVDADIRESRREADKASDRLFNELYHDRARLENTVDAAVGIFEAIIEHQSTYARNLSATGSELLGRVKQYVVDNE